MTEHLHDAHRRLAAWTAEGSPYKLASGSFSEEARRHYRAYVTDWLSWPAVRAP